MRIDGAGRDDEAGGVEHRGGGVEHDPDAVHRVGVAGPADRGDPALGHPEARAPHAEDRVEQEAAEEGDLHQPRLGPHAEPVAHGVPEARQHGVRAARVVGLGREPGARCPRGGRLEPGRGGGHRALTLPGSRARGAAERRLPGARGVERTVDEAAGARARRAGRRWARGAPPPARRARGRPSRRPARPAACSTPPRGRSGLRG